jgi:hypothetical protein
MAIVSKRVGACALVLALSNLFLLGQKSDTAVSDTGKNLPIISIYYPKAKLVAQSSFGVASPQLSTNKLFSFLGSGDITQNNKNEILNSFNKSLTLGYQLSFNLGYFERLNTPETWQAEDYKQGLSVFQHSLAGISLQKDAVKLLLNGNAPYAGQILDLGGSMLEQWRYSGIKYHFSFPMAKSRAFMAAAVLAGHSHRQFHLDNTTLLTAADGSSIQINEGYELYQASASSSLGIAGMGMALDFFYKELKQGKGWQVRMQDFGFIAWNTAESIVKTEDYIFEGLVINDLGALSDSLLQAEGENLQDDLLFSAGEGYTRLTPFFLQAEYQYSLGSKSLTSLHARAQYRNIAGYTPQAALGLSYQGFTNQLLRANLAYGGFNALALELNYNAILRGGFRISAQFTNVFAAITPNLSGGGFGQVGLSYSW